MCQSIHLSVCLSVWLQTHSLPVAIVFPSGVQLDRTLRRWITSTTARPSGSLSPKTLTSARATMRMIRKRMSAFCCCCSSSQQHCCQCNSTPATAKTKANRQPAHLIASCDCVCCRPICLRCHCPLPPPTSTLLSHSACLPPRVAGWRVQGGRGRC